VENRNPSRILIIFICRSSAYLKYGASSAENLLIVSGEIHEPFDPKNFPPFFDAATSDFHYVLVQNGLLQNLCFSQRSIFKTVLGSKRASS